MNKTHLLIATEMLEDDVLIEIAMAAWKLSDYETFLVHFGSLEVVAGNFVVSNHSVYEMFN